MEGLSKSNFLNFSVGGAAAGCSLYFFWARHDNLPIALVALFLFLICIVDAVTAKIPNVATLALAIAGLGLNGFIAGGCGLLFAGEGLLLGLGLLLIPYLMRGMGAGDVKALAAIGAVVGPGAVFQVFLHAALIGGGLAMLYFLCYRNLPERLGAWRLALFDFVVTRERRAFQPVMSGAGIRFPYAAAIAFGYCAFLNWGAFF